jgi:uncharacterized Tic20 family protein
MLLYYLFVLIKCMFPLTVWNMKKGETDFKKNGRNEMS